MTLSGAQLLSAAVDDSAAWCGIVCSTHGLTPASGRRVWSVPRRSLLGYPDATTLVRGVTAAEVLDRIDSGPGASVKDSYADLDLAPHGFEVLFDASWIARPADPSQPAPSLDDLGWESVDDEPALRRWASAHGMVDAFRATLLGRRDVRIIGRRDQGEFVAGAVALGHPDVVGLSNVFCTGDDPARAYAQAAAAAVACYPGRSLVGYESGGDLARALAAGFGAIGPLRVWVRS